ncbi:hypothetical protein [Clostridium septicum]|uniref:Uncharacterized protein n=1 Tax=Clostridium septicum TaxID=1504 RepID=A0A9N7JIV4_CLOSE|nr:hypothetical protein [Clostridium septicum]AYE33333.1 hypothetical protein CP523_02080 [Clostridium septicum]MDU1313631.1 hypothetical protein [Clostridium septicum]QAS61503.1 hypothetical protein EI377_12600 [Clostridium septicum]UEC22060.1 hypothetical protein LK444_06790 [Clostridium septicum]USR99907.1 hypothetical protein NH397_10400 [Clostridium septicum]
MKIKMICNLTNKEEFINIPIDENRLLSIQGNLMNRNTDGYILGTDVKYYDENNNEINDIFSLNKYLLNKN